MKQNRMNVGVVAVVIPLVVSLAGCGKSPDKGASTTPSEQKRAPQEAPKETTPSLDGVEAKSIQIVDGETVSFRGESGVAAGEWNMGPSGTIPILPCIWVIRSIGESNKALADQLGVKAGTAYMQLPEGGSDRTTHGLLPAGKKLWRIKEVPTQMSDAEVLADFASMMEK